MMGFQKKLLRYEITGITSGDMKNSYEDLLGDILRN